MVPRAACGIKEPRQCTSERRAGLGSASPRIAHTAGRVGRGVPHLTGGRWRRRSTVCHMRLRRHDRLGGTRYQMREKIFAVGNDFWIETEDGQRAFKVDGKALRIRSTFILESPSGEELFKIQEKKLRIRDTMEIERDGETVATIKKALITPLRDRFTIHVE